MYYRNDHDQGNKKRLFNYVLINHIVIIIVITGEFFLLVELWYILAAINILHTFLLIMCLVIMETY